MESSTRKVNVVNLIIKLLIFTFEQYTCLLVMFYNMYTYKHIGPIHVPIHLPTIDGLKFVSIKDTHT